TGPSSVVTGWDNLVVVVLAVQPGTGLVLTKPNGVPGAPVGDGRVGLYAGFCPRAPRGLPVCGHPSRPAVAGRLERSTRRLGRAALERLRRTAADRRPSRPCSGWGLPCRTGHPVRGGLLHRRFTLTSSTAEAAL